MFTPNDLEQIGKKGIDLPLIEKQITHFIRGFPFIRLIRPAVLGDGIVSFDEKEQTYYIEIFESRLLTMQVVKFVPASGAASRMFKSLFEFKERLSAELKTESSVAYFFSHIKEIAFYDDLRQKMKRDGMDLDSLLEKRIYHDIIDYILSDKGLNYASLPKGLIKFHRYQGRPRTSVEEHMVEAAEYARDGAGRVRLHFTISPEHREKFFECISEVKSIYEKKFGVIYDISFSVQNPGSDIIAVDENNQPFRSIDGALMFRPGGHGALLENLGAIDADLVFIKNIDNIVPDRLKPTTFKYKKLLGGYLLSIRDRVNYYLNRIKEDSVDYSGIEEMVVFATKNLWQSFPLNYQTWSLEDQKNAMFKFFNRPIRVCGMVKNEGEPGGGPFWVTGTDGKESLQIVESSQVNLKDEEQNAIFTGSTHFNPVDLVCSTKDFTGKRFNLQEFVDENTGFISLKSNGSRTVKAQELPGLWNGSMAGWITLFVEVPIITFNPVKTVNDLLRAEHLE
ncbi:MAG: DUF4301 family protein [Bacteroidales bacterium]|nr:DUF4301 family protein [Bacteroidales bacterium]